MPTQTINYSFDLPIVGADDNLWGGYLNGNWTSLDALLKTHADAIIANTGSIVALSAQIYPVGSIYISVLADNPDALFGGTWVAFAEGRVLVGVGTGDAADATAWANAEKRGTEGATLTEAQLPTHTHEKGTLATSSAGSHNHGITFNNRSADGNNVNVSDLTGSGSNRNTVSAGAHTHPITGDTAEAGSGEAHNNIQPSIAVHMWQRTA